MYHCKWTLRTEDTHQRSLIITAKLRHRSGLYARNIGDMITIDDAFASLDKISYPVLDHPDRESRHCRFILNRGFAPPSRDDDLASQVRPPS